MLATLLVTSFGRPLTAVDPLAVLFAELASPKAVIVVLTGTSPELGAV